MAFKKINPKLVVASTPDQLLRDLPRRKISDVLPHQREIMRAYAEQATTDSDVALQLPTGSGKTLVALLIAEWRRRRSQERIVYLCPTKQLVNQVVEQAEEKYGLTVLGFTGSVRDYSPAAKTAYRDGERVAITTYSSLFNTNPFFVDADVVIFDDAHAGDSFISGNWSVRIDLANPDQAKIGQAMVSLLRPLLDPQALQRLSSVAESSFDRGWVDKLPTPRLAEFHDEIVKVMDQNVAGIPDLSHPWSMIRGNLLACHIYLSAQEILIRPLIPPTWTHTAFTSPKQRIYMSATLGEGGDLERLVGRRDIKRLSVSEDWDRQGVGRRFFIFPGMALKDEEVRAVRRSLMKIAGRSLVLVPSDTMRDEVAQDVQNHLKIRTFSAIDIEKSKKPFIAEPEAVAIVANRYDGIDFPGDECRLLFIEGLPRATNAQERFIMSRMGASTLFNERIQNRVLQAIGRCTRALEDYSAVVVSGEALPEYLSDIKRRKYLHPELQAELAFGVEQSKGASASGLIENFKTFLENGEEWEGVNQQIVALRKSAERSRFPALDVLSAVARNEILFQERMWQSDFVEAFAAAQKILGALEGRDLRGYRALWHYLAGAAAHLAGLDGTASMSAKAKAQFEAAKDSATSIPWLVHLARSPSSKSVVIGDDDSLMGQIERVESMLSHLGVLHDRDYSRYENEVASGLQKPETFEEAQRKLGLLLGFDCGNVEADGSPDPWWIAGKYCIVFEDHAGGDGKAPIDVKKARQASGHPAWMKSNVPAARDTEITPVLVTATETVKEGAAVHLDAVALWPLKEFRGWAEAALAAVRKIRKTFHVPGDLEWRSSAATAFKAAGISAPDLAHRLRGMPAAKLKGVQ